MVSLSIDIFVFVGLGIFAQIYYLLGGSSQCPSAQWPEYYNHHQADQQAGTEQPSVPHGVQSLRQEVSPELLLSPFEI